MFPVPHLPSNQTPAKGGRASVRGFVDALTIPVLLFAALYGVFWAKPIYAYLFGPVNVFNRTDHMPSAAALAGRYEATSASLASLDAAKRPKGSASILLTPAGHAEVHGVPAWDGAEQNCTGSWVPSMSSDIALMLRMEQPTPGGDPAACREGFQGGFHLIGHAPPYRIWQTIGDPQGGAGLLYTLRSR